MTVQVIAITSDLFLQSRISELAGSLGAHAKFVTTERELIQEAEAHLPGLVILDLTATDYDPFSCAHKLKMTASPPSVLAIFPHVRTDLKLKAEVEKIDYIVPNSSFLKTLRNVLEKGHGK